MCVKIAHYFKNLGFNGGEDYIVVLWAIMPSSFSSSSSYYSYSYSYSSRLISALKMETVFPKHCYLPNNQQYAITCKNTQ
jgi:hypothetical protein